ncbi:hypothetical protein [Streptomyces sp. NBC_00338]|uniref:hypothetical protein n=1 Tax=Streptomyces sp. NBC_00338 TaxID=2975715 RepID=UPI00225BB1E7|nr:hypothetical protein [Streptomyces sp. NBC_00338]MCX5139967.1 hypothetical protein [Streptomyces sp. NBC_00338]
MSDAFNPVDSSLDEIINIASGLKGKAGGAKEVTPAQIDALQAQVDALRDENSES